MTAAIRAEWLKLTTTRTFRRTLYSSLGLGALFAFIGNAQGPPPWPVDEPLHTGIAWMFGSMTVAVLAVILGSRTVTEEFAHDTIVHTFVADPQRRRSMVAKAVVSALAASLVAAALTAAVAGVTYAMAGITGGAVTVHAADGTAVLGMLGAAAAVGVIGTGVGAVVRHQVPAIVGGLLWILVIENLLSVVAGPAVNYLPARLAQVVSGVPQGDTAATVGVASGLILVYAAVATAAGLLVIRRRDVL